MGKNFELKCKLNDIASFKRRNTCLSEFDRTIEEQVDIYYKVKTGRLKLRIINNTIGNLIFYERNESTNIRISKYIISKTIDFVELREILNKQFRVLVTVIKQRQIFLKDNIRIHLDTVKGLGKFLEIEIIYSNFQKARKQMEEIIFLLNLNENNFINVSYSDLLIKKK